MGLVSNGRASTRPFFFWFKCAKQHRATAIGAKNAKREKEAKFDRLKVRDVTA
jgi:hypothetical protein